MKQLGNLAIVCAKRPEVLLQVCNGRVVVHVGQGPQRAVLCTAWDDDKGIENIIYELNFGQHSLRNSGVFGDCEKCVQRRLKHITEAESSAVQCSEAAGHMEAKTPLQSLLCHQKKMEELFAQYCEIVEPK